MRRRSISSSAAAVATTLALAAAVLAFSGLNNGSFENGSYTPNASGFQVLGTGATNINDWTVVSGSVDWIGTYWQAQDGSMSLDMSGSSAGTVSTVFDTSPDNDYLVSFWLSGNPDGGSTTKTLTVQATGAAVETYHHDRTVHENTRTDMKWQQHHYSFRATSTETALTFTSGNVGAFGPALDNVTVTDVAMTASGSACKNGRWQEMTDDDGAAFRNQGACVSHFATAGQTPIGPGER